MSKNYPDKICVWCGKSFTPTHPRQISCKDTHYKPCPDCGELVKVNNSAYAHFVKYGPKRCKSCAYKQISISSKAKSDEEKANILEKRKATNLKKFGSEFASQNSEIQNKVKNTNLSRYGVEHPLQSLEIRDKMYSENEQKYGVKNTFQLDSARESARRYNIEHREDMLNKRTDTNLERYGVSNAMQNDELKSKMFDSVERSLGVRFPMQSECVKAKSKDTSLTHYGVEHPSQSDIIQDKIRNTCVEKYGVDSYSKTDEYLDRVKSTCIKKYGTEFPMQNSDVKAKSRSTCLSKYDVPYFSQSRKYLADRISDSSKLENYLQFKCDPEKYLESNYLFSPTIDQLTHDLGVSDTPIYDILVRHNCQHLVDYKISSMEFQLSEFIRSIAPNIQIIHNDRCEISPCELDIYLPDLRIGFECNPTVTHNSSLTDPWGDKPKSPSYHFKKTKYCEKKNIFLFHIFGYEWTHKRNIIFSMISNLLGCSSRRIYARNTHVSMIDSDECTVFLNNNHRQGNTYSSIRIGLRLNDTNELVSIMTFNKMRSTMGRNTRDTKNTYELSRFCNLCNTSVVGGASKLFKFFIENYSYDKIVSFSDRAHTRGDLYQLLGFSCVNASEPSYVWVDYMTDVAIHRANCQKHDLRNLLKDDNIDIEHKTEREIMIEHGFVQVFDSGTLRWEYLK